MRCRCHDDRSFQHEIRLPDLTPAQVDELEVKVKAKLDYVHAGGRTQLFTPVKGETEWSTNLNGHGAEYALCLYRGVEWSRLFVKGGRFVKLTDTADGHEVRHSPYASAHLVLYKPGSGKGLDDPRAPFHLVTGRVPTFVWRGWLYARDGQRKHYWKKKGQPLGRGRVQRSAHFVPQVDLHGYPHHEYDPGPADVHVHGWARDATGDWTCNSCGQRFTGQVPVDERHPDGVQT